jgi:SAM-dependent methyltransferase
MLNPDAKSAQALQWPRGLYGCTVTALAPSPPLEVPPCPVCDARQAIPRFALTDTDRRIVVCCGCGLGSLHPMPSPHEIAGWYPEEYYGPGGNKFESLVEVLVRLVGGRHARHLSRGLAKGARILDLGCGRGVLLGALADRGFEVHGVERSESAVRGADPRAKIQIAEDLVSAGYPAEYFDEVIVWHVLEHLPDPAATLAEIRRILRPGGKVIVAVPNFSSLQARWAGPDWFHLDPPRHLYHFPLSALLRLLRGAGFAPVSVHHFSLRQNPFGWVQSALNRRPALPKNALYVLLHGRGPGESLPLDARTRVRLRLAYLLGMPIALVLAVLASWLRDGATVHVVARADG